MRALRGAEAHAWSFGRCRIARTEGRRVEALATGKRFNGRRNEVFSIAWGAQDIGGGARTARGGGHDGLDAIDSRHACREGAWRERSLWNANEETMASKEAQPQPDN